MKQGLGTLLIGFFGFFASAHAVPLHYTFEGNITDTTITHPVIADLGVSIGDSVSYTFLVDTERTATRTLFDGTVIELHAQPPYHDLLFFVDYLGGGLLDGVDLGISRAPYETAEYNWGSDGGSFPPVSSLTGGSPDHLVQIRSFDTSISDWIVGTTLTGIESMEGSGPIGSLLYSSLTLTSITEVPEPVSILLLSLGLTGLGAVKKLKKIE